MRHKVCPVISTVLGKENYVKMSVSIILVNNSNMELHGISVLVEENQNTNNGTLGKKVILT